ncbi:MAG: hypothetical protein ABF883_11525, partial [Acetobacter sp.]|uniref:hypothetical protein n=2 Tax=Acetobacter sp. TaxID=440 RepID=UPI0039E84B8B
MLAQRAPTRLIRASTFFFSHIPQKKASYNFHNAQFLFYEINQTPHIIEFFMGYSFKNYSDLFFTYP